MPSMQAAAQAFLSHQNIAVVGVSSTQDDAANSIYRKLRSEGFKVFAINPKAQTLEGDPAYPNLKSLPIKPDGVVVVTKPEVTEQIVQECVELGIKQVWMHKSMGNSVSPKAVEWGRAHGLTVIDGGCPQMYCTNADFGHRCLRWWFGVTGALPKRV